MSRKIYCGVTGKLQKSFGARYNSKNHLGAKHLSLELLANSKNHLDLSITPKIMKKLGI
jgi:hypothetical protein